MRVIEYLSNDTKGLVEAVNRLFEPDTPLREEIYREHYLPMFVDRVLIQSDLIVTVDHFEYRHDDPIDDRDEISVLALYGDREYSMSFIPWSEVMNAPVRCGCGLNDSEIAATLFWEITMFGDETQMEEIRDDLHDRSEEVELHPDRCIPADEVFERILGPQSEEDRTNRKQEIDRKVANWKTCRVYRNGAEWSNPND